MTRNGQIATDPIIVLGAPRSGTTYLNAILNAHPDVNITHETRVFVWAHESLNTITQIDQVLLSYRDEFRAHLLERFPLLIRDFYQGLDAGAYYWGDKNPHYASPHYEGCLETIRALFPGARFVHIIRDGRDVVTSLIRKGWVDFETAHKVWIGHVDMAHSFGSSVGNHAYLEVRYENLIEDDVGVAEDVFAFLGIDFRKRVRDYCIRQSATRTPLSEPTRDISGGAATSDWADVLGPERCITSLDLLAEHLVRCGYETSASLGRVRERLTEAVPTQGSGRPANA